MCSPTLEAAARAALEAFVSGDASATDAAMVVLQAELARVDEEASEEARANEMCKCGHRREMHCAQAGVCYWCKGCMEFTS